MADIPDDMVFEILKQLPVLSLLRFKCVSKRLGRLIESPYFVKSHLKLSNKSHSVMIFLQRDIAYHFDLDAVLDANLPLVLRETGGPWGGNFCYACFFVGVCNGLLCLYKYNSIVFLWNPSTRKHFQSALPQYLLPIFLFRSSWGFGYDIDSDDYKVVVRMTSSSTKRYGFWVYSLKSNLWEGLEESPYLDWNWRRSGVFVNGALHWLVSPHDGPISIVALDLGNFRWRMFEPPNLLEPNNISLTVLNGCLHATYCYHFYYSIRIEIWVMEEYGVESWSRFTWSSCPFNGLRPLTYLPDSEYQILFGTSTGKMVVYNYVGRRFKEIDRWPLLNLGERYVYIPSLVNPEI